VISPAFSAGPLVVNGPVPVDLASILCPEALRFIEALALDFGDRRRALLEQRRERQERITTGDLPEFLSDTAAVRDTEWLVAPIPPDLADRRTELSVPVDRAALVQGFASGARVLVADFEAVPALSWHDVLRGHAVLCDFIARGAAWREFRQGRAQRTRRLPTLMVRPRGWPIDDPCVTLNGEPVAAPLVDVGLYLFHNARALDAQGTGPYVSLTKLESHLEARWWHEVFLRTADLLGVPRGSIRAAARIDSVLAAFEMDEILFELREHSAGLSCAGSEYVSSVMAMASRGPASCWHWAGGDAALPPCLEACVDLAVRTCHRRGIHAIGTIECPGLPDDPLARVTAAEQVRAEAEREATVALDGTSVSDPRLVPLVRAVFDERMPWPNQIHRRRSEVSVGAAQLLAPPS
jgi:malate synthase